MKVKANRNEILENINPTLPDKELIYIADMGYFKVGDGKTKSSKKDAIKFNR